MWEHSGRHYHSHSTGDRTGEIASPGYFPALQRQPDRDRVVQPGQRVRRMNQGADHQLSILPTRVGALVDPEPLQAGQNAGGRLLGLIVLRSLTLLAGSFKDWGNYTRL
jgi:hypothetical protein